MKTEARMTEDPYTLALWALLSAEDPDPWRHPREILRRDLDARRDVDAALAAIQEEIQACDESPSLTACAAS